MNSILQELNHSSGQFNNAVRQLHTMQPVETFPTHLQWNRKLPWTYVKGLHLLDDDLIIFLHHVPASGVDEHYPLVHQINK